jgi:SAM-dependent methyltransferase
VVERLVTADRHASPADYLIYCIHIATYEFARQYVRGRRVLDFGCGTGYGTHSLASDAATIVGVDISAEAIEAASAQVAPNLTFQRIARVEEAPLPLADSSVDVVLSFQVIEHLHDPSIYLREARRVLVDDGVFICATPDRRTRLYRGQRPWNEFHIREYGPELADVLSPQFTDVQLFGMQADNNLFDLEYRRCARVRLATLPFTFPGAPEGWRRFGLRALRRASGRTGTAGTANEPDYDYHAVHITPGVDQPGPDLIAIGRPR